MTLNELTALVVKLNKLTATGQLRWMVSEPPRTLTRGTDNHFPLFLVAERKGRKYALYEERERCFDGEHESFYWTRTPKLGLLDREFRLVYEFPYSRALEDLFEAARRQAADVDDVFGELNNDE